MNFACCTTSDTQLSWPYESAFGSLLTSHYHSRECRTRVRLILQMHVHIIGEHILMKLILMVTCPGSIARNMLTLECFQEMLGRQATARTSVSNGLSTTSFLNPALPAGRQRSAGQLAGAPASRLPHLCACFFCRPENALPR